LSPADQPATVTPDSITAERIAVQCLYLADKDCKGYSPLYERLTRALAADDELLERLRVLPDAKRVPLNLLAATHWLIRREPGSDLAAIYNGAGGDPWPGFRTLVVDRFDEIVELTGTHSIQTNEVGRSATLLPAFGAVIDAVGDRPLALIEIGPSAGLNLLFDRYAVTYSDGRRSGPIDSPVQLQCEVVGSTTPPLPTSAHIGVARREGIDLSPVDVRDNEAVAWLAACIWPDVPGRRERFEAAVALARSDPPRLHRGDALDLLGGVVDRVPAHAVPVVFSTWALAYFDQTGRQRVHEILDQRGGNRDLAFVTAEHARVTPWVPAAPRPPMDADKGASLVGMTTWRNGAQRVEPLAWTHPHGQWIDWFEAEARA
jgi:hypothetical protein